MPSDPTSKAWSGAISTESTASSPAWKWAVRSPRRCLSSPPRIRIIRRVPSRYLHYYFYVRDPAIGPFAMCVGTYLPFQTTYYLNGHNFIEIELRRQGVSFRKDDNAFLSTSDPQALQPPADKLI